MTDFHVDLGSFMTAKKDDGKHNFVFPSLGCQTSQVFFFFSKTFVSCFKFLVIIFGKKTSFKMSSRKRHF